MTNLYEQFSAARKAGYKQAVLRTENLKFKLSPAGNAIYITLTKDGTYIGKQTEFALIIYSQWRSYTEEVIGILNSPADAAIKYGRKTGECAICGRRLDNKQSVAMGIGPICAEKFPMFSGLLAADMPDDSLDDLI